MPRIIAGKAKGLTLKSLKGNATRPSGDRLKEALFSILQNQIYQAKFLDVFAGSGQIGLEALSRGAAEATFIENNRQAFQVLKDNVVKSGLAGARILQGDARRHLIRLAKAEEKFDIIYLDPPWDKAELLLKELKDPVSKLLSSSGQVILELDEDQVNLGKSLALKEFKTCHYGRAVLLFYNI